VWSSIVRQCLSVRRSRFALRRSGLTGGLSRTFQTTTRRRPAPRAMHHCDRQYRSPAVPSGRLSTGHSGTIRCIVLPPHHHVIQLRAAQRTSCVGVGKCWSGAGSPGSSPLSCSLAGRRRSLGSRCILVERLNSAGARPTIQPLDLTSADVIEALQDRAQAKEMKELHKKRKAEEHVLRIA
jgi:hypothetical protein